MGTYLGSQALQARQVGFYFLTGWPADGRDKQSNHFTVVGDLDSLSLLDFAEHFTHASLQLSYSHDFHMFTPHVQCNTLVVTLYGASGPQSMVTSAWLGE